MIDKNNKKSTGRPTKYSDDMCEKAIEMMKEGASKYEVALALDICEDTFYEYIKVHPHFSEAIKKGEWFSRGAWESAGRLNLQNKDFNYTGWYMNMKNRHGYADKQETNHSVKIKQEDAIKELA